MKILKTFGALMVASLMSIGSFAKDYVEYVNPMIGTDNHGHVAIGANVPWGMVNMGPVELGEGWDWCSGYNYSDTNILGFSPLHLSGTGCSDLGDIIIMPYSGGINKYRGEEKNIWSGHFSSFKHENEVTQPGYYSVLLDRWNIKAEMTASNRVAWQRFTWLGKEKDRRILIDMRNSVSDVPTDCEIHQISNTMIAGHRTSTGWAARHTVYFVAEFSKPMKGWYVSEDNRDQPGTALASTRGYGEAEFDAADNGIVMRLAISSVSEEGALANLKAEPKELATFEDVRTAATKTWNEWLGLVDAEFFNDVDRTSFYTALYHVMFAPQTYSDVDGGYTGADNVNRVDKSFTNYTVWSCWDTYRSFHPLATLVLPQQQKDWVETLLHIYREQGYLPIWHLMNNETGCMVGMSSVPILADMCIKGYVPESQMEEAFKALKTTMLQDMRELKYMKTLGYIPNNEGECVAKTMEYCIDDWAVAQVAKMMGKQEDYEYFLNRSHGYRKMYDKETGFIRSLNKEGKFLPAKGFKPNIQTRDYTEGNPWQYLWLAPHDVEGLQQLMGGKEIFASRLDSLFAADSDLGEDYNPDIAGLIGQYAHGNEPSHHIAYLYNYADKQNRTADITRQIMTTLYNDTKDGLAGNEDCGQMSAWYVLSAMGLYQVEPCGGVYQFGSPLITKASFKTASGKTFTVIAHDNSAENKYIKKVKLNGKTYKKTSITFAEINSGATLEFFMGK